jgi:MinD superfamily P-loop ATPase
MRQLVIVSGKGGTGKTTVAGAFIALAWRSICVDADVDAPNLHLLLHPKVLEEEEFQGAKTVVRDEAKCTECGKCEEFCRFQAIEDLKIDPFRCEGCGVCVYVCPEGALKLEDEVTGSTMLSRTRFGPFSHARLKIGAEASGKLVTQVRKNIERFTCQEQLVIIDGCPGIGCPVIASITGTDLALAVTEPSVSGLHDLQRILAVTRHFGIKSLVCINKFDLCPEMSEEIEGYCSREGIEVVGKIPFDAEVLEVVRQQRPLEDLLETKAGKAIEEIWETVRNHLFPEN